MHAPSPLRARQVHAERMLIARVAIALGLALLLVVGAWSASHGKADAHAALCLAPGVSSPSAVDHHDGTATVDVLASEAGPIAVAALCCFLLVLLLRRLLGGLRVLVRGRLIRAALPIRAGPRPVLPALTLVQLSVSRT
jgi:hypothetical protein